MSGRIAWLLALAVMAACGGGPSGSNGAPGWRASEGPRVFRGAELYGHINGGSEIFLELGFDRLDVEEFSNGEQELSVDHYHMTDAAAALAIYLMKCGVETPSAEIIARNTVSEMQIHLVHGPNYVTVNNLSGGTETGAALLAFARNLVDPLPSEQPVVILGTLPTEERVPGSERIIRGPFTLQALYTFGEGDVLLLAESNATAVSADYGDVESPTTLIQVDYGSTDEAMAAFRNLNDHLDAYLKPVHNEVSRLVFKDWAGKFGEVVVLDARIGIRVHLRENPGT